MCMTCCTTFVPRANFFYSSARAENDEVLVVCGSVFFVSEARQALGIDEARDSDNITKVAGKGMMNCKERLIKEGKKQCCNE